MKKASIMMALLVLTLSVLTACGCRNSKPMETAPATTMPIATTLPTTEATTVPTTAETTMPTDATIPDGNGPLSTADTTPTDSTNARTIPCGTGTGTGITGSITD